MKAAVINGIVHHYKIQGTSNLPTLFFANSLGSDLRIWDGVVAELSQDFRIVRYDMRGHGLSSGTEGPYSLNDLAQDALQLMCYLHIEDCFMVGLSIGGMIAQILACTSDSPVKGVVLSNTAPRIATEEFWIDRIARVQSEGLVFMADEIVNRWFTSKYIYNHQAEIELWKHMVCQTSINGYVGCCHAISTGDLTEYTRRINIDTLVIAGELDMATPANCVRQCANLIKGSQYDVIQGNAHLPCIEDPKCYANSLFKFINSTQWFQKYS